MRGQAADLESLSLKDTEMLLEVFKSVISIAGIG